MNLRIHSLATDEIDHEVDYYESIHTGRADGRVLLLSRFPFALEYQIVGDNIVVLALAHTRRRPGYGARRR